MAAIRVFLVDDSPEFVQFTKDLLAELTEFQVVGSAHSAEDALAAIEQLRPDLVLMDVNLPGIDGLEATRQILKESQPVVVLLLSTYEAAEYGPKAAECGASAYIPKSEFLPDRLVEAWSEGAGSTA